MKKKYIIIFTILAILLVKTAMAYTYPIIISGDSVNHNKTKETVTSIPVEYYKHVTIVEFTNAKPQGDFGRYLYKSYNDRCYHSKIWVYAFEDWEETLIHELGHIYEHCELKKKISTEEFANNFEIK